MISDSEIMHSATMLLGRGGKLSFLFILNTSGFKNWHYLPPETQGELDSISQIVGIFKVQLMNFVPFLTPVEEEIED